MITTQALTKKYGVASANPDYLVMINLPYPMRLAWDVNTKVSKMRCHRLVKDQFLAIFNDLLDFYGYDKLVELGIDLFGGCFVYRKMRNGTKLSRHSWGVAIDLDPVRNQNHETGKTARFNRPEYQPMIDIFYKHNFISYGVEIDRDYMHFEVKS